jgi:hypothetical protein
MRQAEEKTPLWERQSWESATSFSYFHTYYLSQPPLRSVADAYRKWEADSKKGDSGGAKNKKGQTVRPSNGFSRLAQAKNASGELVHPDAVGWEVRARAWDDHLAAIDRERWAKRRAEWAEQEWDTSQKLLEKARQMLTFPIVKTTVNNGQTTIEPAEWRMGDVAKMAETASKLARLSSALPTEMTKIEHGGAILTGDISSVRNMSEDELNDQIERLSRAAFSAGKGAIADPVAGTGEAAESKTERDDPSG